jgi:hypothetical protein
MPGALERIVARGAAAKLLYGEGARYSANTADIEQIRVRNLLQAGRFLEDEFERQRDKYAASLQKDAVRRYIHRRTIGVS